MKKIFTLIVSLGILSATFAQGGRHDIPTSPINHNKTYSSPGHDKGYKNDQPTWQGGEPDNTNFGYKNDANDRRFDNDRKNGFGYNDYDKRNGRKVWYDKRDNDRFKQNVRIETPRKDTRNTLLSLVFSIIKH